MIPLPKPPQLVQKTNNTGIFEIEGLYPGYGITIGNAFRRVLLSSLPSAALTWVKIKNAPHEFTAMEHVMEDVVQICLNLKQINLKLFGDEPQKITLHVKGEKEVTAGDFEVPAQVEIVNKDLHIATLTDKRAEFEVEAQVEKGFGYMPVEARTKEKPEIGIIMLDAMFSSVQRVSFHIDHMRVGERTDFDLLRIEIETNGTITPEDAMRESSEILRAHFDLFVQSFVGEKEEEKSEITQQSQIQEETGEKEENEHFKKEISELNLSTRTINALVKSKIKTVGGIMRKSEKSLREFEGMGEKGIEEIKKALKKLGLELKAE